MSTIIGWMLYGKGWRNHIAGQPSVRWSDDGQTLFHSGEGIIVEDFKRTARDLAARAERLLDGLMAGSWAQAGGRLDMRRIIDNMVRVGAGQSFAMSEQNRWLDTGPGKVMRLLGLAMWDTVSGRWKGAAARKWLRQLRPFREVLMLLIHIWGGQPGRGPELIMMRHCDSWQLICNVFMLNGHVVLVIDRDKMKVIRDNGRKVARFLPDGIGRIMVAYIAWLMPFKRAACIGCKLAEPDSDQLEYMWRDSDSKVQTMSHLSRGLAQALLAGTGVSIGAARYRAVAIELRRRIRGLAMRQADREASDGDEDDHMDIDPLTGEPVNVGSSWNIIWDLQSTHGTRIARQHYAVHVGFPGRLQPEIIATFQEISSLWHQFLDSEDPGLGTRGKRKGLAAGPDNSPAPRRARTDDAGGIDAAIQTGLQKLLGTGAAQRSDKQGESMQAIIRLGPEQSAIIVLPTGAGKSILFMLLAIMAGAGTSIVVVPFVALMDDLVTRARAIGVDCIQYRPTLCAGRDGLPRAARLVVASANVTSINEFIGYAETLLCAGLLQRIFVDECHTVIMDVLYRARLGELQGLHWFGCPVIFLTATLLVVLESWFRGEVVARSAVMIRDRTIKLNYRYRVEEVSGGRSAVVEKTLETARQIGEGMIGRQKGVIYQQFTNELLVELI